MGFWLECPPVLSWSICPANMSHSDSRLGFRGKTKQNLVEVFCSSVEILHHSDCSVLFAQARGHKCLNFVPLFVFLRNEMFI